MFVIPSFQIVFSFSNVKFIAITYTFVYAINIKINKKFVYYIFSYIIYSLTDLL